MPNFCVFNTNAGFAGIVWTSNKIIRFFLPEKKEKHLKSYIYQLFPGEKLEPSPPEHVAKAIRMVCDYFEGKPVSFKDCKLDYSSSTPFQQKVYQELLKIGRGSTISYGRLALACGNSNASRAVGTAVGNNPMPLFIPCHRVINSSGKLGGFSAEAGIKLKMLMLRLEGIRIIEKPILRLQPATLLKDIDLNKAIRYLKKVDPDFSSIIDSTPKFNYNPESKPSVFISLLESIISQQLTGKAAQTIYGRVRDLFSGKSEIQPLDIIRASEDELRSAGLSGNKVAALKDLANFATDGKLPDAKELLVMPDEAVIELLVQIRGIGRWTVEMLLLFGLGRADITAKDDLGLKKGLANIRKMTELPKPEEFLKESEKWRPYRSIASWYLWRAADKRGK